MAAVVAGTRSYGTVVEGDYEFCGQTNQSLDNGVVAVGVAFMLVQVCVALASLGYALRRLGLRNAFVRRHAAYVLTFACIWCSQVTPDACISCQLLKFTPCCSGWWLRCRRRMRYGRAWRWRGRPRCAD